MALRQGDALRGARVELAAVEQAGQPVAGGRLDELVVGGLRAQRGAHASDQLLVGERLDDVVDGARVEACHTRVGVAVRGEEDHRRRRRDALGLDRAADLVPVAAGHRHVEQQQVDVVLARQRQRVVAVGGGDDLIAGALEPCADHRQRDAVVVGDENYKCPVDCAALVGRSHHQTPTSCPDSRSIRSGFGDHIECRSATPRHNPLDIFGIVRLTGHARGVRSPDTRSTSSDSSSSPAT